MLNSIALTIQSYAEKTPDQIAVIAGGEKCSYKYLAECNRKVAAYLEKKGVKSGERIIVEADHILDYGYF